MFGRKRAAATAAPGTPVWAVPSTVSATGAYVAVAPVTPRPPDASRIAGTTGWAANPALPPSQQVGMYAGTLLNQFPAMVTQPQLWQGREGLTSSWYFPAVKPLPLGSIQQTQQPAYLPGAQRYGSQFSGPIGPLSARLLSRRVLADQVRQSGMALVQYASQIGQ